MSDDDPRDPSRLHLVKPSPPSPRTVGRQAEPVHALVGGELDVGDNEALLALALGEDVAAENFASHEVERADVFRRRLERGGGSPLAELATALRMAHRPPALDERDREVLLALGAGGEVTAVSPPLERAFADELRHAFAPSALGDRDGDALLALAGLEADLTGSPLLDESFADVLRAAYRPSVLDELAERRVQNRVGVQSPSRGWRVGALMVAAGVALVVGLSRPKPKESAPALARSRSAQSLFDPTQPLARGGESKRATRILTSRASDFRNNRFAQWGVE
ncbi:MAG: hypothetical protein AAGA56_24720 [Myxococcota bacterium]